MGLLVFLPCDETSFFFSFVSMLEVASKLTYFHKPVAHLLLLGLALEKLGYKSIEMFAWLAVKW